VDIDTFGANIHTLLSHGFFMEDGLMGEFAKEKINEVIKFLNDKESEIKAKEDAQNIIKSANKTIESTVKEIKAVQADKEKTKEIRKKFEAQKKQVLSQNEKQGKLEQKLKSVEERIEQNYAEKVVPIKIDKTKIRIGDKVRLKESDNTGEVVEINNKNAVVAFGNMLTSVSLKKIEKIRKTI